MSKKLVSASAGDATVPVDAVEDYSSISGGISILSNNCKLYWFYGKLNGQPFNFLLDCGATVCCIAKRCITSNRAFKNLKKHPYRGPRLTGASNNPLNAEFVIRLTLEVGTPILRMQVEFVVVEDLPYSCIAGNKTFLTALEQWGVNNSKQTLSLNSSTVNLSTSPQAQSDINLITSNKVSLLPGETKLIKTVARGVGIAADRPITMCSVVAEGEHDRRNRTNVLVHPAICNIGENNDCVVPLSITNMSKQRRTVGKGVKIAYCYNDFDEFDVDGHISVSSIGTTDPIDILCSPERFDHLSVSEQKEARELLTEFRDIFSVSNDVVGRATHCEFDINTNQVPPISTPLRRVPLHKEKIVRELLENYKKLGLISKIDSPFRAPTVLVQKKNVSESPNVTDQYRLCVDYRVLNESLDDSGWPTPSIEHCLDAAADSVYFSALDFNSGYHQIPCTDRAKDALAFSPGYGFPQYTWEVMPMGVKPAASCFQRSMEKSFDGLEACILPPFYDDVTVKSGTFVGHVHNARSVLQRVRECGFTLNVLKCYFFQRKIKYLGHVIENGKISLDPDRIEKIVSFPTPHNVKSLRRFTGMAQFCSRFVPDFNSKLAPLYALTRKDVPFEWNDACQNAFEYVKLKLTSSPVLQSPRTCDTFILETDASDWGIGGCLKGRRDNGDEYVVSYHSSKLNDTEYRWNIVEKEGYAIVQCVDKFRHYLIGKRFVLRTDNRVLTFLKSTHTSKSRKLLNWALTLSEYDYDIVHIPSKSNEIADCLSRLYSKVNVISELEPRISRDELLQLQKEDTVMMHARTFLETGLKSDIDKLGPFKRFRKQLHINDDGILCWRGKIVVPEQLRSYVLEVAHDHPTSGHFAEDRTWSNLTSKYFWPYARNDVVNWIRSCQPCNEFNQTVHVNRPLNPIEIEDRFDFVCYDLAGPFLPTNIRGNQYALILVDHFSKWVEIMALKEASAPTIAKAIFDEWCCRYGIMTKLHSDGGQNVHSGVVKELCSLIGTVKSKSSRLHPQGDGMAETTIKTIKTAIKKQVDEHGQDWDLYLQPTAFALRTSINHSTQHTPAELVVGDNLQRPIDVSSTTHTAGNGRAHKEFASSLVKKLDISADAVRDSSRRARQKMKEKYDKRNTKHDIQIGNKVMLWWPYYKKGIPRSFQPSWKGPFTVVELIGNTNCRIEDEDGRIKCVHLNQLKVVQERNSYTAHRRYLPSRVTPVEQVVDFGDFENLGDVDGRVTQAGNNGGDDRQPIVNHGWCNIDESNILPNRTRNQGGGGNVGLT